VKQKGGGASTRHNASALKVHRGKSTKRKEGGTKGRNGTQRKDDAGGRGKVMGRNFPHLPGNGTLSKEKKQKKKNTKKTTGTKKTNRHALPTGW